MSPSRKVQTSPLVNRQVLRPSSAPAKAPEFRSWREQADYSALSLPESPKTEGTLKHGQRSYRLPFWQTANFRLLLAVAVTAGIAYAAYSFLQGS